jgi:hypothetical protein
MISAVATGAGAEIDRATRATLGKLKLDLPDARTFETAKQSAYADLVRRLSTPAEGAERLLDLALARGKPAWVAEIFESILKTDEDSFDEFLTSLGQGDNQVVLDWRPKR